MLAMAYASNQQQMIEKEASGWCSDEKFGVFVWNFRLKKTWLLLYRRRYVRYSTSIRIR